MLGGTVAAAIAAPVCPYRCPTPLEEIEALHAELLSRYMEPALMFFRNEIDRQLLEFHGVTHFDKLEPYGNLHTVEVCLPKRRFDEECSTDVRFC